MAKKTPKNTKDKDTPKKDKDTPKTPKGKKYTYKEYRNDTVGEIEPGTLHVNPKTGGCAFVCPVSDVDVVSALDVLKVKVTKKKPLTLEGVIDLNPEGENNGDFSNCKPFKVENGVAVVLGEDKEDETEE